MSKEIWRRDDGWEIIVERKSNTEWTASRIPMTIRKIVTYDDLVSTLRANGYGEEF